MQKVACYKGVETLRQRIYILWDLCYLSIIVLLYSDCCMVIS